MARIEDEKKKCRVKPNLYHALSIDEDISSYKTGCFENKSDLEHKVILETYIIIKLCLNLHMKSFMTIFQIIKLRIDDLKGYKTKILFSI